MPVCFSAQVSCQNPRLSAADAAPSAERTVGKSRALVEYRSEETFERRGRHAGLELFLTGEHRRTVRGISILPLMRLRYLTKMRGRVLSVACTGFSNFPRSASRDAWNVDESTTRSLRVRLFQFFYHFLEIQKLDGFKIKKLTNSLKDAFNFLLLYPSNLLSFKS
jgi:hypothetical protein